MNLPITAEECARRILQRELRRQVVLHDDGLRSGMYDLRIGSDAQTEIAIECVGAVDEQRTETWNVGPARGSFSVPVSGNWHVVLQPDAVVKRVKSDLPKLLAECRSADVQGFTPVDGFLKLRSASLHERLSKLRVDSVACYEGPTPGRAHLGMTGFGGPVDPYGTAVPKWIGDFLRADQRQDVLQKLRVSGAEQCHVFVIVSFGGVPWPVESYLGTQTDAVPQEMPDLPEPIDAAWIMYGTKGVCWHEQEWKFFDALIPAAPECD